MALRFEITDENSPYEIFVREVVAMDGRDNSEIILINSLGCPTDPSIMQQVSKVSFGAVFLDISPTISFWIKWVSCMFRGVS